MQSRPITIASVNSPMTGESVRIAFNDWDTDKIDYAVITKESFLSVADEKLVSSEGGKQLRIRTIRGNGVNTPIVLIDNSGEAHLPLLVQYPVVRGGKYIETAYYMSTHPGLVNPEVVNAGRLYVRNVIEVARERLKAKGISVSPKIADIAEREDIPKKFLEAILAELKQHGFVRSRKGRGGGYLLARSPALKDIMRSAKVLDSSSPAKRTFRTQVSGAMYT